MQLTYDDVLIVPNRVSKISSRFDTAQCNPYYSPGLLPLVSSPMDSIPSPTFIKEAVKRIHVVFSHRFQSIEDQCKDIQAGAQGVIGLNSSPEEVETLLKAGASHLLLDVANGGNQAVIDYLKTLQQIRELGTVIWAGNVAHRTTYRAIAPYCDYVRVGIGGGSVCTTRTNTGVGVGNITAIQDCAQVRRDLCCTVNASREDYGERQWLLKWRTESDFTSFSPARIVADGGIKTNGDICKALAAGADLVMLGRMFAASWESAAPEKEEYGQHYKLYRGMASKEINEESGKNMSKVSVEGHQTWIKRTHPLEYLLNQIEANLRSAMSYVNARDLEYFRRETRLHQVSPSTYLEGKAHAQ